MVLGERFVLKHHFNGVPKAVDFEYVREHLPLLKDGEILIEAKFLSVDPYLRPKTQMMNPPFTMVGSGVYKVRESRDKDFPQGAIVIGNVGWIKTGILNPRQMASGPLDPVGLKVVSSDLIQGLSESLLLGACGMPGNTAYFGLLELCQPKSGETVVVTGAAGAVGSLVGQIAKIKGCKVVGFAGSDKKCEFLKEIGFDKAYNYKTTKIMEALKDGAPKGVDCFYDNVGGSDAAMIINHMNVFGRIAICGAISSYNATELQMVPATSHSFVGKQLKMEGFLVSRWANRWEEGIKQMAEWIKGGKIKTEETIVEGFDKMPQAFIGLFSGENVGKMIVKA